MSRPKFTWRPQKQGDRHLRGDYALDNRVYVSMGIYTEREATETEPGKHRIKCVTPPRVKLSKPVTFPYLKEAKARAEDEAKRIYNNKPPVDHKLAHQNQQLANERNTIYQLVAATGLITRTHDLVDVIKQFLKTWTILLEIKMEPLQAAYQAVTLKEKCGELDPAEIVGKYLDEFVRVKAHMTVAQLFSKVIRSFEKSKTLGDDTKRDHTNVLLDFMEAIGEQRLAEDIPIDEFLEYYWDLDCGAKRAYDIWLVIREAFRVGFERYGCVTRWVHGQLEGIDLSAKANTLTVLMPLPMLQGLFDRCKYLNDAIYLATLAWIPLRRAELKRLDWKYIEWWSDGRPRIFHLPAKLTKGEIGFQEERFIDIPPNLGDVYVAFRQESGPIIVGEDHQERLKELAEQIDPKFGWPHNVLRRSCISNGVADTNDKAYWRAQAGHDVEAQKRYVRPVDPLRAREYRACIPDLERLGKLPPTASDCPQKQGRPALARKVEAQPMPAPAAPALDPAVLVSLPQPVREDGKIRWNKMTSKFLEGLVEKYTIDEIAAAWGESPLNLTRQLSKHRVTLPSVPAPGVRTSEAETDDDGEAEFLYARPPKKEMPWDNKARFLHILWEMSGRSIAKAYNTMRKTIYAHADELKLPRPDARFFMRHQREIPPEIKALMAKLDAEDEATEAVAASREEGPKETPKPGADPNASPTGDGEVQ